MQKRWHHMEVTICQWYSAYKNQIRYKTSSHITPYSMNGRVQTLCQNCASGNQHKARNAHGKARSSHHGETVRSKKHWTETRAAVKNWQKARTRPNPDPKLKAAMDTKTEQFKQIAREAKEAKLKASVKISVLKQRWHFWQFYQQMEGNDLTKTIPDLEDTNRVRLKTKEEKGQALLGRFIEQSNQNNWEERKHVLSDLNRSAEHVHKVALTMNSQRRNSTKPLEEAERILHLVQIGFDIQTSRT